MCSTQKMSQDELRRAIVSIQMDASIDESEKAARRQALLTGKWKPGDGASFFNVDDAFFLFCSMRSLSLSLICSFFCFSLHRTCWTRSTRIRRHIVALDYKSRLMKGREDGNARESATREKERTTLLSTTTTSVVADLNLLHRNVKEEKKRRERCQDRISLPLFLLLFVLRFSSHSTWFQRLIRERSFDDAVCRSLACTTTTTKTKKTVIEQKKSIRQATSRPSPSLPTRRRQMPLPPPLRRRRRPAAARSRSPTAPPTKTCLTSP